MRRGPKAVPLTVGSIWHSLHEFWFDNGWCGDVDLATRIAGEACDAAVDEHPSGDELEVTKLAEQLNWVRQAWPAYVERYGAGPPTGTPLGSEVKVWLEVTYGFLHDGTWGGGGWVADETLTLVGILDRPCLWNGYLVEGQVKTMSPRVDLPQFLTEAESSWHMAVYTGALAAISLDTYREHLDPDATEVPKVYGAHFDVAIKSPYPQPPKIRTKDGRITPAHLRAVEKFEGRLEEWSSTIFHSQPIPMSADHRLGLLTQLVDLWLYRDRPHRNPALCGNWYRRRCEFWEVCHGLAELGDNSLFEDRKPDYVDEREEL